MIDAEDRQQPRFPAGKEDLVKQNIYQHLLQQKEIKKERLQGIASGACGGDILFHEVCEDLNIPTEIYLALPVEEFKKHSVSFAGKTWDERFDKLIQKKPVYALGGEKKDKAGINVYELANEWMLDTALSSGGMHMTLIALWDRSGGDGKGGTEHMVKMAKKQGAEVDIIDITKI
jgi:hypothetical protein